MGLNQSALSRRMGVAQSAVYRWLNGAKPQPLVAKRLAAALSVRMEWLISGEGLRDLSEHEKALADSIIGGGHSVESAMREDATPYRTPDSPEELLRDEIMASLNAAQLSPDDLRRKTLHQRIDDYLNVLKEKGT